MFRRKNYYKVKVEMKKTSSKSGAWIGVSELNRHCGWAVLRTARILVQARLMQAMSKYGCLLGRIRVLGQSRGRSGEISLLIRYLEDLTYRILTTGNIFNALSPILNHQKTTSHHTTSAQPVVLPPISSDCKISTLYRTS